MVGYRAVDEAGVCPNLMTRFREEYYVPEAKKEKQKGARSSARATAISWSKIRAKHIRESRSRYRASPAKEKRLI